MRHSTGCFRCNPGGGLSSIDGGGCISLNIGYDQWPTSMQLKCQNRQCLNSRCRTNSETFTAEQTCRSRYSIQLGNICAEKRSDRVRFAAFVGVSAYSSSIRAGAGAQFDHYFEPISCPWFSGRSSPCTNNFRLYLQACASRPQQRCPCCVGSASRRGYARAHTLLQLAPLVGQSEARSGANVITPFDRTVCMCSGTTPRLRPTQEPL